MNTSHQTDCILCCRKISIFAIGECDHPICYLCFTRWKVLCDDNFCTVCRTPNAIVIFTKRYSLFSEIQNKFSLHDRKYSIIFENIEIQKTFEKLFENECNECTEVFPTFQKLQDHVRKVHGMFYCELCTENLKLFPFEKSYYSRKDLASHKRRGDPEDTSQKGHPLCEFCDKRYVDKDDLFRHLRKDHFFCHFCDADGKNQYYDSYDYLRNHFRTDHYLCEEDDCVNEKFTSAFRTEIDLKAHAAVNHSRNKSKAEAKQARMLDFEFSYAPAIRPTGASSPRGGRYAQGRRRNGEESSSQNRNKPNQQPEIEKPNTESVQEFPFLSDDIARTETALSNYSSSKTQSKGQCTNGQRRNVISGDDFPALRSTAVPAPSEKTGNKTNLNTSKYPSVQNARTVPRTVPDHNGNNSVTSNRHTNSNKAHQEGGKWGGGKKDDMTFEEEFPSLVGRKKIPPVAPSQSVVRSYTAPPKITKTPMEKSVPVSKKIPDVEIEKPNLSEPTLGDHFVVIKGKSKKKKQHKEYVPPPDPTPESNDKSKADDTEELTKKFFEKTYIKPKVHEPDIWHEEVSFGGDDFPPLAQPARRPPGFSNSKPRAPPPGFSAVIREPVSEFANKTLADVARESIRLHPNPAKVEDPPPDVDVVRAFLHPPHFDERNNALIRQISLLSNSPTALLDEFKRTSGKFRFDAITADEYHVKCLEIFGAKYLDIFPELVCLLPNIEKQQELFAVHNRFMGQRSGVRAKKHGSSPLVACDACSQVILVSDCQSHKFQHEKMSVNNV